MRARGTGKVTKAGYIYHKKNGKFKFEHVMIAEKLIGKPLKKGQGVHHINGIKSDNRNENLVIFPSYEYHALIHSRTRAFDATGDANKRKCSICKQYDDQINLYVWKHLSWHKSCKATYDKARKDK